MIPDTLPHPTQPSITTFRTILCAGSDSSQDRPATHRCYRNSWRHRRLFVRQATKGPDGEQKPGKAGTA